MGLPFEGEDLGMVHFGSRFSAAGHRKKIRSLRLKT
jgi:hypothetical protein